MTRYELTYRDDAGHKCREVYHRLDAALAAGQALASYGLKVNLRHVIGGRKSEPVRCVA